ncbi:hypothetical protein PAEAM_36130 [Paenibacillus sp. GM1FR]|uniref:hypothetical protein n=1 Tax=Paenibacillus sp. GM1FR TaxID=2059267 RepID=UPI000C2736F0|nr:hypothetical protein [Paenibacillus sp. GM1FR]PJN58962.1 hypothetical protein PAEAM_36130 [Paenibacillus sp. GM1FR]
MGNLNFDEKIIKQRLKERIYYAMENTSEINKQHDNSSMQPLIDTHNIYNVEYFSTRKVIGKFIVFSKKAIRKLIYPILMKQIHFNQRVIDHLYIVDQKLNQNMDEVKLRTITSQFVEEMVSEFQEILQTSVEQIKQNTISEKHLLSSEMQEIVRKEVEMKVEEAVDYYKTDREMAKELERIKEISDVKSSVLRDIANIEQDVSKRYQLLLLALKESPENLEIEAEILKTFGELHQSELKTNEHI